MKKLLLILSIINIVPLAYSTDSTEKKENFSKDQEKLNHDFLKAAYNGDFEKLKSLIKLIANIDIKHNFYGDTALRRASRDCYIDIVKLLLSYGAHVDAKSDYGETALMAAAESGCTEIANLILSHGAHVDAKSDCGYTALMHAAICTRCPDIIELLFDFGASRNGKEVIKLLLDSGASIDVQNKKGRTALMLAAYVGNAEGVKLLLSYGASVNIKSDDGQTALDYANDEDIKLFDKYVEYLNDKSNGFSLIKEYYKSVDDFLSENFKLFEDLTNIVYGYAPINFADWLAITERTSNKKTSICKKLSGCTIL